MGQPPTTRDFIKIKNWNANIIEKIMNKITSILINQEDWNNPKKMESKIIETLQDYEFNINPKFNDNTLKFNKLLKKEFINNSNFYQNENEKNYSLLHIAVLNNWQQLVTELINKWPVNINHKDSSGYSAWNRACLSIQKENALTIKKPHQLNNEDRTFLDGIVPVTKSWFESEKKEINKINSENRSEIFNYYLTPIEKKGIQNYIIKLNNKHNLKNIFNNTTIMTIKKQIMKKIN